MNALTIGMYKSCTGYSSIWVRIVDSFVVNRLELHTDRRDGNIVDAIL